MDLRREVEVRLERVTRLQTATQSARATAENLRGQAEEAEAVFQNLKGHLTAEEDAVATLGAFLEAVEKFPKLEPEELEPKSEAIHIEGTSFPEGSVVEPTEIVYQALLGGAKTAKEIADATGLAHQSVGGRLSGLMKMGKAEKNGAGWSAIPCSAI